MPCGVLLPSVTRRVGSMRVYGVSGKETQQRITKDLKALTTVSFWIHVH